MPARGPWATGGHPGWPIRLISGFGASTATPPRRAQRLARNRINTRLIAGYWGEICRLTASPRTGTDVPSAILPTLQRGPSPSSLARALAELGRVIKTLHLLGYVHDPAYCRTIHRLLSRGQRRNALTRDVFYGHRGQLRKRHQVGPKTSSTASAS